MHCETDLRENAILSLFATHFVMPLLTPELHARISFKLLMRLLLPTLGKPDDNCIKDEHSDHVQIQRNECNPRLYSMYTTVLLEHNTSSKSTTVIIILL